MFMEYFLLHAFLRNLRAHSFHIYSLYQRFKMQFLAHKWQLLSPREQHLAFICIILVCFSVCSHSLISPLQEHNTHTKILIAQTKEDKQALQNIYDEALHSQNTLQSQQHLTISELKKSNAILESLTHKIYAPNNTIFENLNALIMLAQNSALKINTVQIENEALGIILLRGSGEFNDIARFILAVENLRKQYMGLDFIEIDTKDSLEFEMLLQDMRV